MVKSPAPDVSPARSPAELLRKSPGGELARASPHARASPRARARAATLGGSPSLEAGEPPAAKERKSSLGKDKTLIRYRYSYIREFRNP
jgi:hypothetical protein